MPFDFLGFTFRARDTMSRRGRFTGFDLTVSDRAIARMGETVRRWHLRRQADLTWGQLRDWIGPVIAGWMACYGRFRRSELYALLARINYHLQKWVRHKYRKLHNLRLWHVSWGVVTFGGGCQFSRVIGVSR